ncbi:polysaccharide deacetylase family protein [Thermus hydrothermalis]|uniref:polysaccharide deacetylase family protein n=1 Tax=Thermus hydrothermalis TaxID=2908148 RepID=UPI001FAA4305|nr:polysaccharide deacetylase family protein [Thermus hydrothermalis]
MWPLVLLLAPLPWGEKDTPAKPLPHQDLPVLHLALPGVVRAVYLDNGYMEAAHVVLEAETKNPERLLHLAQRAAEEAWRARPSLDEVDLSVYGAPYRGPEDLPLFTASVPKPLAPAFFALREPVGYERLWLNPGRATRYPLEPVLEDHPAVEGPEAFRARERANQILQSRLGAKGSLLYHGNPTRPFAALTFDDAPHPLFAPLLLDLLKRLGLKATFFVIGRNAEAYPYFVRDMVEAGHELGNHTYHHVRLAKLSPEEIRRELLLCNEVLKTITGRTPQYFRPPGGRYNPTVLRVAEELGLTTVFWTDDPGDYAGLPRSVLGRRLEAHLRPGGIVLLHDNVVGTLEVLPLFAHKAKARGLALGTVGGLLAQR